MSAASASASDASAASSASDVPADLRAAYASGGQGHVFRFVDAGLVSRGEAASLVAQLRAIDVPLVNTLFAATMADAAAMAAGGGGGGGGAIAPWPSVQRQRDAGLGAIAAGRVGALTLAGGQGTRLGSARPKGEYDIGLPSGKSLFALQAQRLARLRALAGSGAALPWYIMTSPMTDADTRATFAAAGNFGLPAADVRLFCQGTLPCLDAAGRIVLESGAAVAEAPDGNGGIYRALHASGAVADMRARGLDGVHVFAVDNAIVRAADPAFLGFCLAAGADVGSKVCARASAHERVGVLVTRGGAPAVVEYSELAAAEAEARDATTGELAFNAGNLCIHYYSVDFLDVACAPARLPTVYHLARKAIPHADAATGRTVRGAALAAEGAAAHGVKLETFIFDVFPAARAMAALDCAREDEFAPVKNAPGAADDSPDTARALVLAAHARWLAAAGAQLEGGAGAEVSPLLSYAGEGLEAYAGMRIACPALLLGPGEAPADFAAAAARGVNVVPYRAPL